MEEQRRALEKGYITLREAAEISTYSPDYLGQLIRAGKLEGEQVYSSVAWVTTEEALRSYMAAKSKSTHAPKRAQQSIEEALENFGVYALSILTSILAVAVVVLFYIFAVAIDRSIESRMVEASLVESNLPVIPAYE